MAQINKPNLHFNTKLYTGTGASSAKTGVGFQPDLVWIKQRSGTEQNAWFDSIRGATKYLSSNMTSAEATTATTLTSFDSDGFTEGGHGITGNNTSTYASWCFKGGGTSVSNTDGSITSTVSANTTAGFSIVSYTGTGANATVGHGLGVAPKVIITKSRVNAENWGVYHEYLGNTKQVVLNTTGAATGASAAYYNNTSPTSTVFSVGTADSTNDNQNMIAYCFAEKKGYSKIGSYIGNNNADGTFVYTGFKPAFILSKNASATTEWYVFDNRRLGYNPDNKSLRPNKNHTETSASGYGFDILSNGFKTRVANNEINGSGNTHIYLAIAEQPLVGTNNIPATAR